MERPTCSDNPESLSFKLDVITARMLVFSFWAVKCNWSLQGQTVTEAVIINHAFHVSFLFPTFITCKLGLCEEFWPVNCTRKWSVWLSLDKFRATFCSYKQKTKKWWKCKKGTTGQVEEHAIKLPDLHGTVTWARNNLLLC